MGVIEPAGMISAFTLCLVASLIWAPLVFLGAMGLMKRMPAADGAWVWPAALTLAAAPALLAPAAALFGLSLRRAEPLPPMAAPEAAGNAAATEFAAPLTAPAAGLDIAALLNAGADLYFYGFILFAALGLARLVGFAVRVRYSAPIHDQRLRAGLDEWRRRMGVRAPVRYAYSDAVSSVCVHGYVRPVILMPDCLLERVSTDNAILMGAHEMAHIKRGDTWLFAFCAFAKALFWFNPFMRRIVDHAQLAAERAADALVIRRGVNRKDYARCFVESLKAASGLASPQHALVPSFTPFDKRSRRERLDAILSGDAPRAGLSLGARIGMALIAASAGGLAFGQAALAVAPPPAQDALTVVPVDGRISSTFGVRRDPVTKEQRMHQGVDIAAPTGTPVLAAGDGKVIDATARYNDQPAWGKVVVIDHGHGLMTRYAQLDSYVVRKGDGVKAGDVIGAVGATGRATGPHLHFEVIADGALIDPAPVVAPLAPPAPKTTTRRTVVLPPTAPTPASPAPAPRPAPDQRLAPAPEPVTPITPDVAPAPDAPPDPEALTLGQRLELRLAGPMGEVRAQLRERLRDFPSADQMNAMTLRINDVDLDGFPGAEELADLLADTEISVDALADFAEEFNEIAAFTIDGQNFTFSAMGELSEEEREAVERARERVEREAEKQRARAERHREKAMRAQEKAMREVERHMQDAERRMRDDERRMREEERRMRERRRERAFDQREDQFGEMNEDMLALREEALREAEESLRREREEIARMREELRARKNNQD